MDNIKNSDILNLFNAIARLIKKHGVNKISTVLKSCDVSLSDDFEIKLIEFIKLNVSSLYSISYSDLDSKKKGDIARAKELLYITLNDELSLSSSDIANYRGISRQYVSRVITNFRVVRDNYLQNKFEPNKNRKVFVSDDDRILYENYIKIKNRITEFKEKER